LAIKNHEWKQRIFKRLAERFSLLDKQHRFLHGLLGFRGGITFDMDQGVYESHLKLNLLAAQLRSRGQRSDLCKRATKLGDSL
jgi:hypothetical protein